MNEGKMSLELRGKRFGVICNTITHNDAPA
jgi:hypothetical protein